MTSTPQKSKCGYVKIGNQPVGDSVSAHINCGSQPKPVSRLLNADFQLRGLELEQARHNSLTESANRIRDLVVSQVKTFATNTNGEYVDSCNHSRIIHLGDRIDVIIGSDAAADDWFAVIVDGRTVLQVLRYNAPEPAVHFYRDGDWVTLFLLKVWQEQELG